MPDTAVAFRTGFRCLVEDCGAWHPGSWDKECGTCGGLTLRVTVHESGPRYDEQLRQVWARIVGPAPADDEHVLVEHHMPGGLDGMVTTLVAADDPRRAELLLADVAECGPVRIGLTTTRGCDLEPWRSHVLWAEVMGTKAVRAAAWLPTPPSIVMRYGDTPRRLALWALREPLDASRVEQANRRLAHELETPKSDLGPAHVFVPPGYSTAGGTRVSLAFARDFTYTAGQVVDNLSDHPKHARTGA